jgi:hypothetical protein
MNLLVFVIDILLECRPLFSTCLSLEMTISECNLNCNDTNLVEGVLDASQVSQRCPLRHAVPSD